MPVLFNLRHLEKKPLHLQGDLSAAELDLAGLDELIRVTQPLSYDLQVQKLENGVLIQGQLHFVLDCECARCLKPFQLAVNMDDWACHLALEGEEKAVVVNDCVDLTPNLREDMVLAFPQHPLCKPECSGLPGACSDREIEPGTAGKPTETSSAWAELNKLKI